MSTSQKETATISIAKNSLYLIIAQIFSKGVTFFYYLIIARHLGDVGIGKYSFILSLVGIFYIISEFGLENLIVRDIAIQKNKALLYLSNASLIKLSLAIISIIIITIFINFTDKTPDVKFGVYIISITLLTNGVCSSLESTFNAFEKLKYIAYLDIFINCIKLAGALILLSLDFTLISLLFLILFLSIARLLLGLIITHTKFFKVDFLFDKPTFIYLFRTAFPFALMGIITIIYFRVDSILLSLMKGDAAVGWYAAAFNFITMLMFLSYAFCKAIFPIMSKSFHESKEKFLKISQRSISLMFIVGMPIPLGMTFLADKIILLVYGDDFTESITAMKILGWAIPLIYLNSPLLRMLYSANKQNMAMAIVSIGMIINIVLNFILIPDYSYVGTSISTVAANLVNFILYYAAIYKTFNYKLNFDAPTFRAMSGLIILGFFLYFCRDLNLFFLLFISPIMYFGILYAVHFFTDTEIQTAKNIIRGVIKLG